ncbi:hypothetical protein ACE38V_08445 [Cytobacillus sp. Hz8]|uniref:hypothetical protein n=1 Tax=Cytobacillus sp. Hz8 TaxID=3347168 RepID=UPI0035DE2AF7
MTKLTKELNLKEFKDLLQYAFNRGNEEDMKFSILIEEIKQQLNMLKPGNK